MTLTHDDLTQLLEMVRAGGDVDLVRESVEMVLQALIEAEATEVIGAGPHERSETRTNQRNGSRARLLSTKAGDVELRIPKLRRGSFFPAVLERRRRIDRALNVVASRAVTPNHLYYGDAQPNEKQVGDKGIDGRVRFHADEGRIGQAFVSVKGGRALNPGMVRDLAGTVQRDQADMGILIALNEPTRGMREQADKSGSYEAELTGQTYPKIQLITVADLMAGKRPTMPTAILPYLKAKPRDPDQLTLDGA